MNTLSKLLLQSVKTYTFLLVASTALILYGTLFPVNQALPETFVGYDKIIHFLMFGTWTFFFGIIRFLKNHYVLTPVFIPGALFGLFIEILQHFLPTNRTFEVWDLAADLLGTLAALLALYLLLPHIKKWKNTEN